VDRTIAQRDLRNDVASILREAQAGTRFTITVHGKPVARLVPLDAPAERRVDVDWATFMRIFETPVDKDFGADIDAGEPYIDWDNEPEW
jgi:prevent-host-death family protein